MIARDFIVMEKIRKLEVASGWSRLMLILLVSLNKRAYNMGQSPHFSIHALTVLFHRASPTTDWP